MALKISRRSWAGARPPTSASVRAWRQAIRRGVISAQRASERSPGIGRSLGRVIGLLWTARSGSHMESGLSTLFVNQTRSGDERLRILSEANQP